MLIVLANALWVPLSIILATFVLEDPATILTAAAVSHGTLSLPVALGALYLGVALGDLGLYGLGYLAARFIWARRWIPDRHLLGAQVWLDKRLTTVVLSARFLPGARLPTYTACGFLGMPLGRFALAVVAATLIWTTLLFAAALVVGAALTEWLGLWSWAAAIIAVVLLVGVRWHLARRAEEGA